MIILAYSRITDVLHSRRGITHHVMDGYKRFCITEGHYNQTSDEAIYILMEIKRK